MIFEPSTDPVFWSVKNIVSLGHEVLHELAKRSSATVNSYKLVVGRCLLAVEQSKLCEAKGYSGAVHYAICVLGLDKSQACELRRVARELEALPKLSRAAELGQVPWGKLRAIVSKATLETEDFWIGMAPLKTCNEIERLVAATERGKLPWDSSGPAVPEARYQLNLGADAGQIFARVIQAVSQDVGKPMTPTEVLEHLAIEKLAKRPLKPEVVEAVRKEARRGCAAAKRRHSLLVKEARELARDCGLIESEQTDPQADPLAVALGSESLFEEQGELLLSPVPDGNVPVEILEVGYDQGDEGRGQGRTATGNGGSAGIANGASATQDGASFSTERTDGPGWDGPVHDGNNGGDQGGVRSGAPSVAEEENAMPASGAGQDGASRSLERAVGPGWDAQGDDDHNEGDLGDVHSEPTSVAEADPRRCENDDESIPNPPGQPDWGALIDRALKEKKFFIDLESEDDWRNKHIRFNPEARFATPAQRRELLRRDGYCCSNPGCPNHLWLEIHHLVAVSRRGKTLSFNLVALCSRCHRNVHRGFLKISGDADRGLVFRDAEGNDLERAHVSRVANWLNLFFGWSGGREDFHRPGPLAAA